MESCHFYQHEWNWQNWAKEKESDMHDKQWFISHMIAGKYGSYRSEE